MRPNFLLLFFVLFYFSALAQVNRFYYEYKYMPDSTAKDSIKTEMMLLDIDEKGSKYYSHAKFVADSALLADVEKQMKATGGRNISINRRESPGSVRYSVTKTYPDFKVVLHKSIVNDNFAISEDQKPEWKILPDRETIGEYKVQKAVTSFGGRQWIAWFSSEIPFQDGPYKFFGLPGLIVKIEDEKGGHKMTLVGNKKLTPAKLAEVDLPQGDILGLNKKEIPVTEKQYKKLWADYKNDPTKNFKEMLMKNGVGNQRVVVKTTNAAGKEISDPAEVLRQIEKSTKEALKKNNNTIEPELD